jgi:hypothetical protein
MLLWNYHSWSPNQSDNMNSERLLIIIQTCLMFAVIISLLCDHFHPVMVALMLSFISIFLMDPIQCYSRSSISFLRDIMKHEQHDAIDMFSGQQSDLCTDCSDVTSDLIQAVAAEWTKLEAESQLLHPQRLGSFKGLKCCVFILI